jgi:hypothetical protein
MEAQSLAECAVALYWAAFTDLLAEVWRIEDGRGKLGWKGGCYIQIFGAGGCEESRNG